MEYIISDIHGEYDLFIKLLDKIRFNENDKMIICGDIIDKGQQSIKLLQFVRKQKNMLFIMGNHEYDFIKYYNGIMQRQVDGFDEQKVLLKINDYFEPEINKIDWEDLYWLEDAPFYYEADNYICVHAGVMLNSNNEVMLLKDNDVNWLVYDRSFKNPNLYINNSKCVFYGHTPTSYLTNECKIITYKRKDSKEIKSVNDYYKIHLDCGVDHNGVLGCFRVDDCKTFYVKK